MSVTIVLDIYGVCFRYLSFVFQISYRATTFVSSSVNSIDYIQRELWFSNNQSLELKHILFYYQADCQLLQCRRSGLCKVTKTDKMLIRK